MSCAVEEPVRHKRGDVREDGKRFWQYAAAYANGEYWVSEEQYEKFMADGRRRDRARQPQRNEYKRSEAYRKYNREYTARRRAADPLVRLAGNVRGTAARAVALAKQDKPSRSFELLGTDVATFRDHLESQFLHGMTWDNYGEWEIDHIVPLSSGKTPEEVWRLCHYSNTQPLWKPDNRKKHAKLPEHFSNN